MNNEQIQPDDLRQATFPQVRKGYDRQAVHSLLDRVAEFVERRATALSDSQPDVRRELERVGERTASILTAAEEAAAKVRADAKSYAEQLRRTAEEETRKAKLSAGTRSESLIAEAEAKAEKIMDDAIARRRQLNQAITSLVERRDEIAQEAAKLGEELLGAVDSLQTDAKDGHTPAEQPDEDVHSEDAEDDVVNDAEGAEDEIADDEIAGEDEVEQPAQLPPDQRETTLHGTDNPSRRF